MQLFFIAQVAVDKATIQFDKLYSYQVPAQMIGEIQVGCRVLVPFGSGNQKRQAMVMKLEKADEPNSKIKFLTQLIDRVPLLDSKALDLIEWLKSYVMCTYYEAVRALIPPGIDMNIITGYCQNKEFHADIPADPIAQQLYQQICSQEEPIAEKDLLKQKDPQILKALEDLVDCGAVLKTFDTVRKVGDETVRMVRLCHNFPQNLISLGIKLTKKQQAVIAVLEEVISASIKEICYLAGVTPVVLNTLVKKGLLEFYDNLVYRNPYRMLIGEKQDLSDVVLNEEQAHAFEQLKTLYDQQKAAVSLLYGVTGSGKTLVFLKMMEYVLAQGKQVIVMVPEISLTPQTVQRFRRYFGSRIAVLHSGLSLGERLDEWRRLKQGKADIAIGTRSAAFAPLDHVGLMIMDEEQEGSYKSEAAPRYHARDVAKYRAVKENALLLLCSATPSIDSFYRAQNGSYQLVTLKERYNQQKLPDVYLVDMAEEMKNGNLSAYSQVLIDELKYNLDHGEQSILLLNRRGYHTVVACAICGEVAQCPHCSIALTYHHSNQKLMCHYCGYITDTMKRCSSCGSEYVKYTGTGTQRAQEELEQIFPNARILRMDADTTISKFSHEQYFKEFSEGKYDIMIGTQMVAKGLDFENVTLVGVLSMDQALYAQDYKAYERAFSLLTQVVGRCGRASLQGRAFVQTHTPDNPILSLAAAQDYDRFYIQEIASRRAMLYPPFCDLCTIGFSGIYEDLTAKAAQDFCEILKQYATGSYQDLPLKVLGPVSERVVRVNNKFRYKVVVKCKNNKRLREMILVSVQTFMKMKKNRNLSVYVDMNQE